MGISICIFIIVFGGFFWLMVLSNFLLKPNTAWFCREMGWHDGSGGEISFDGCSVHATCSKCGKDVMQDGQGNWF